jgi:chorismate mutase
LSERGRLVLEVGALKHAEKSPVWRPEREAQILRRLEERNPGPLAQGALTAIWREVISACRELERQGFEVTYLDVQEDGLINLDAFKAAIRPDTVLVSVMFVNNEIGVNPRIGSKGNCRKRCAFVIWLGPVSRSV